MSVPAPLSGTSMSPPSASPWVPPEPLISPGGAFLNAHPPVIVAAASSPVRNARLRDITRLRSARRARPNDWPSKRDGGVPAAPRLRAYNYARQPLQSTRPLTFLIFPDVKSSQDWPFNWMPFLPSTL